MGSMIAERTLAALHDALDERDFESPSEANAFLQQFVGKDPNEIPGPALMTPARHAQELVYDAYEATGAKRLSLARQAIKIYPGCADAYVILGDACKKAEAAKAYYVKALAASEQNLPEGCLTDPANIGHFWYSLQVRPYMRARLAFAKSLEATGETEAAIGHFRELLRFNPDDHQGVRYDLVACLFNASRDAEAIAVIEEFRDDDDTIFAYLRALLCYRHAGNNARSRQAISEAVEANPLVVPAMFGADMPDSLGADSDIVEEAYAIARSQLGAWMATPGAIDWLLEQCADITRRLKQQRRKERGLKPGWIELPN